MAAQGFAISLAIVLPAVASAAPATQARFLHAVAGAPPAVLVVKGHPPRLASSYGKPSGYHACTPGPARLVLNVKGQREPVATKRIVLGRGKYTVIAVPAGEGVELRAYEDDDAVRAGKARVRAIHAAAEIERADVRVDGQVVAPALAPGAATQYASLEPGRHDLSITRPGGRGGELLSKDGVSLVAGTASTAIVVGSRGMPTEFLLVSDGAAGPAAAPATGFVGEVGEDADWLLVAAAALLAGCLGGTIYTLTASRRIPLAQPIGDLPQPIMAPPPITAAPPETLDTSPATAEPIAVSTPVSRADEPSGRESGGGAACAEASRGAAGQPAACAGRATESSTDGARAPDPALWPGAAGTRARRLAVGAVVTAGSLGGLVYRAGRRRGRR